MFYDYLRANRTDLDRDVGEDQTIAWCACDAPDAVFVTADKGALFLAAAELGGHRVATPFDLWADLRGRKLLSEEDFEELCERTRRRLGLPGTPGRLR